MSFHQIVRARPIVLAASAAAAMAFGIGNVGSASAAPATRTASVTNNTLIITGTNAADVIGMSNPTGDPSKLQVDFGNDGTPEATFDRSTFTAIDVFLQGGDDKFTEPAGVVRDEPLTVDAGSGDDNVQTGDGNDTVFGGSGNDTIRTGAGDDLIFGDSGSDNIDGQVGHDTEFLGDGPDTAVWNPGEGSDVIDGGAGVDTLTFNGANVDETMSLSAVGSRAVFLRNVASIRMDMNDVEHLDLKALGGADSITINDMTGTGFTRADIDLSATGGGGDGQPDVVTVNGTDKADSINVHTHEIRVDVKGLQTQTRIIGSDPTMDKVQVNGQGGNDKVNVARNVANLIGVGVDLGSQH